MKDKDVERISVDDSTAEQSPEKFNDIIFQMNGGRKVIDYSSVLALARAANLV